MLIVTDRSTFDGARSAARARVTNASPARSTGNGDHTIEIGLLNNMPDEALRTTERQFAELIAAAAGNKRVLLRRFFLPDLPRSEIARAYLREQYARSETLWRTSLDALIVTGQEPKAARLTDEPNWPGLASIIDWAQENTISSLWSCLAAHAAVLHIDGIERCRSRDKLSGVFDCGVATDHWLLRGLPGPFRIPHSRYNDLPESKLVDCGYRVLMRSMTAGVDTFVKSGCSLSVFFQGHPEYDSHTLLGEYRRDVGRFLACETETFPILPRNYFDKTMTRALANFEKRARGERRPELLAEFPIKRIAGNLSDKWRMPAAAIFRNWLDYIAAQKAQRARSAF